MDMRVRASFAQHGNLLTRSQALQCGLSTTEIDWWVRTGAWIAVRRGVYCLAEFWDSLDEWRGRPLYSSRAASAAMTKDHVLSHDSAGLEHGLSLLLPQPFVAHVTRPGVLGSRLEHGVKHHKAPYGPEQVVVVNGRPVLDMARTAVDIARDGGLARGLCAMDSALRAGVDRSLLREAVDPMVCWPNVTVSREAIELADPGAENAGESLGRHLVLGLGIGRPRTQLGLTDGDREVWCDLCIGRHVFEFDGRIKLRTREDGGVADDPRDALWHEKQRQDFVCGFKLGMSRIVYADLWEPRRKRAQDRLMREYLDTCARFGDDISDLEPYLIRRPRR